VTSDLKTNKRQIITIGFVSLFNDLSSEVVTRVLPLLLISVIKTSVFWVGAVEAVTEATGLLSRLAAGWFSDRKGKRKPFVFWGYALSVACRPLLIFTATAPLVSAVRFLERLGKGLRTAPRDAMIASYASAHDRGWAFNIHRALDTAGAVLGLLCVGIFLTITRGTDEYLLRHALLIAALAGGMALVILVIFVREPTNHSPAADPAEKTKNLLHSWRGIDPQLRKYFILSSIFALALSSDSFIILRARELGMSLSAVFFILAAFNLVSVISGALLSRFSDRRGRRLSLGLGWALYSLCYFGFALHTRGNATFIALWILYGLFYGLTEGAEKALVADLAPDKKRGQAYGWLAVIAGLGAIAANLGFAIIYQRFGSSTAFACSAVLALIGTVGIALLPLKLKATG
jgi:MFS family permease